MANISVTDLTTGVVAGNGVFDELMTATKAHLQEEYSKGRIKGSEYATVYLGALQSVMTQAIQFLLTHQKAGLEADLIKEQIISEQINQDKLREEITVLEQQVCKLKAEYDLIMAQITKTGAETGLLDQKRQTERAQTLGDQVEADSVIGKQKALYAAQTDGYVRDAEQKAAKILTEVWSVQRTTDEGTVADATNGLHDPNIGRAIARLLAGINA